MLAKLSVVLFIGNLAPIDLLKKMGYGLEGFLMLWGVASLLAASFQCRTLRVWDYPTNTCYDLVSCLLTLRRFDIVGQGLTSC